jgi:hypothetical protein
MARRCRWNYRISSVVSSQDWCGDTRRRKRWRLRARIILLAGDGLTNTAIAGRLGVDLHRVG